MPPTGNVCCPKETHRNPAAVVGSPVDLGTAVEEGSPAAAEGLAGMLPAAGHTGHYLRKGRGGEGRGGAMTSNVTSMSATIAQKAKCRQVDTE